LNPDDLLALCPPDAMIGGEGAFTKESIIKKTYFSENLP